MKIATVFLAAAFAASRALAADLTIDLAAAGAASEVKTRQLPGGKLEIRVSNKAALTQPVGSGVPEMHQRVEGNELVIELGPLQGEVASTLGGSTVKFSFTRAAAPPALASTATNASGAGNPLLDGLKKNFAAKGEEAVSDYKNYLVDFSVPATPAFAVLGVTPKTLIDPQSPRDLAASLVTKLSDSDALGNGVGFDVAPYMLMYGRTLTLDRYQRSRMLQTLGRTQLSFGAIKAGEGVTRSTRAAVGIAVPLLDEGDPRTAPALQRCYQDAFTRFNASADWPAALQASVDGRRDEATRLLTSINDGLSADFDACRSNFKKTHWNASRWSLGLGQAFQNTTGAGTGTQSANRSVWTTYAMRLGPSAATVDAPITGPQGQLLLHLRGTDREQVDNAADSRGFSLRRSTTAGIGVRFGSEKFNVSAEASRSNSHYDTGEREHSRKVAAGGEFQITKDLWFVLAVGGQGGLVHGRNSPFVLGSLKFGTASQSTGAFGVPAAK